MPRRRARSGVGGNRVLSAPAAFRRLHRRRLEIGGGHVEAHADIGHCGLRRVEVVPLEGRACFLQFGLGEGQRRSDIPQASGGATPVSGLDVGGKACDLRPEILELPLCVLPRLCMRLLRGPQCRLGEVATLDGPVQRETVVTGEDRLVGDAVRLGSGGVALGRITLGAGRARGLEGVLRVTDFLVGWRRTAGQEQGGQAARGGAGAKRPAGHGD